MVYCCQLGISSTKERTAMQKRAPIGGTVAMNGEFYQGGEFLPSTALMSQGKARSKATTERKQEFESYKWGIAPVAGQRAIYAMLAGVYGKFNRANNTFEVFTAYVSNLPADQQALAARLVQLYNDGERWT